MYLSPLRWRNQTHKTKMNNKLTIALVASLTSTAFAEFKAPLPEFKNEKQLAEWRAEKAYESSSQGYVAEETDFYTGKPYIASSDSYILNIGVIARSRALDFRRSSGFPDGANGNLYAPCPTSGLDWCGLVKLSFSPHPISNSQVAPSLIATHKVNLSMNWINKEATPSLRIPVHGHPLCLILQRIPH